MSSLLLVIGLLLGAALFGGGALVGWSLRDRLALARNEVPMPLVEAPVAAPISLSLAQARVPSADWEPPFCAATHECTPSPEVCATCRPS